MVEPIYGFTVISNLDLLDADRLGQTAWCVNKYQLKAGNNGECLQTPV